MLDATGARCTFEYNKKAILCRFNIKYPLTELQVMKPYICVALKMILCIGV